MALLAKNGLWPVAPVDFLAFGAVLVMSLPR